MPNDNYNENDLKFLQYFDSLYKDAEYAGSYYALIEYFGKLDEKRSKVLNISSFSWNIIFEALNSDFIITVCRIFDLSQDFKPRSDINIINFMNFIKQNFNSLFSTSEVIRRKNIVDDNKSMLEEIPNLSSDEINNDFIQLFEFKEKINALIYFRDKSYAHADFEFMKQTKISYDTPSITYNQIVDLLRYAIKLLLKYRLSFDGTNFAFPASNLHDMHKTIDTLYTYIIKENR